MEKLPMCRICFAENVGMFIVVNRNLHKLYEKLTDMPFVTEDRRPMLACFFCCAKLKQCYRLQRQCLEAEELFAQMMNENFELNPLINQDQLKFCSGFIKSPTENISIVDVLQTESIAITEELPAVCEELDDIIKPKQEHQSDELELENFVNSCLDVADIQPRHSESDSEDDVPLMEFKTEVEEKQELSKNKRRARKTKKLEPEYFDNSCLDVADISPHHSESDLEDDVPLMEFKTEVEQKQEVSKNKGRARETKKLEPENLDNSCQDVADIPPQPSESDSEDDVPLMEFKTEVKEEQEVSKNKQRARETTRATLAKKPKLDTRRTKLEHAFTAERTKKDKSDSKYIRTTQKRTSKTGTYFKEPYKCDRRSLNRVKKYIQLTCTIGEKTYKCDVCQRSFSAKGNLLRHIRIHTNEKPYKCNVCQRSFSEKHNLLRHIRIHTGEKPYKCDVCEHTFSNGSNLTNHIRIHTGEKPYKCDVCLRSFSLKVYLLRHIRIHTGEKPYKCDLCQRSFSERGNLLRHIRIHTGEQPYNICHVCKRNFRDKNSLIKHFRVHTGEKPYKCGVCLRSFRLNIHLTNHTRIHTGEKPYKCDVCPRSFRIKSNLTNHIRIHTGEKPYKCDVCQRSFSEKGNLSKHVQIHTVEKAYNFDVY